MTACTRCGERYYREGLCRACRYYVAGDELAAAAEAAVRCNERDGGLDHVADEDLRDAMLAWWTAVQPAESEEGKE